jgi:hypothetical protein
VRSGAADLGAAAWSRDGMANRRVSAIAEDTARRRSGVIDFMVPGFAGWKVEA